MLTEIQKGLYIETVFTSKATFLRLTSGDGYHFYDLHDTYYDEEGNQIPEEKVTPEMRNYSTIAVTPVMNNDQLNARFISVQKNII